MDWTLKEVFKVYLDEKGLPERELDASQSGLRSKEMPFMYIRAKALYDSGNYEGTLQVCREALGEGFEIPQIYMMKGRALYCLREYETALVAFERAHEIGPSVESSRCIQRCRAMIASIGSNFQQRLIRYGHTPISVKEEWLQTEDYVYITLLVKNIRCEDVVIDTKERSVSFSVTNKPHLNTVIELPNDVIPDETTFEVMNVGVKIKLRKKNNEKWPI